MHAAKRLATRSLHNSSVERATLAAGREYELQLERAKTRLRERFKSLAAEDALFSSLFTTQHLLGVGSFGMVMRAEAADDITAERLRLAQDAKCAADGAIGQRLMRRRSLERHPETVILRRGQPLAVKFEYNIDQQRRKFQLVKEHDLLVELFNCYEGRLEGFPEPHLFGCLGGSTFAEDATCARGSRASAVYHCYHFLAMELLGENLRARFDSLPAIKQPNSTAFPVEFAFDVARQLLTRLMFLHAAPISVTHNDIKLDQLMLGCGEKRHIVYLVDFGLSLKYKRGMRARWGNRRYASRFRQQGINSPMTDLESAAYVVARFLHNDFPWDGIQCSESAKKHQMAGIKSQLWGFVDRMRRGRCLKAEGRGAGGGGEHPPWARRYFADRTDSAGRGGPELLKYMSRLGEYTRSRAGHSLSAEAIDYNYLFNCFVLAEIPNREADVG